MKSLDLAVVALCLGICDAGAGALNGFFPIAPEMVDNNISDWDAYEVTTGFQGRLSRVQIAPASYTYYLSSDWRDVPVGLPTDYISNFPSSTYDMVVSHANSQAFFLAYWNTQAARDAYWNSFLSQAERDSFFYKSDLPPKPGIAINDLGIERYLQPASDAMVIVLGCESTQLADDFFPGISEQNDQTSGPAFAGYDYCPVLSYGARQAKYCTECLTCARWPAYGNDIEDAQRLGSYMTVRGNGNRRLNQAVSCWNWAGYFYDAGYKDGEMYCTVLNEDAASRYIIRGLEGEAPDTLATFPGTGTDGKWILRTHRWHLPARGHAMGDIVHVDREGVLTVSREISFTENSGSLPRAGDVPVSRLDDHGTFAGPSEVQEIGGDGLANPPPDGDCADVVIYSSDYALLTPARDHVAQYLTAQGYPLKVKVFFGPPDFAGIQQSVAFVRSANAAYMQQCGGSCARTYPVLPGPIAVLVGDRSRIYYNLWEDDPVANPCRQPWCRSYNDTGDVDGDGVESSPLLVEILRGSRC